MAKSMKLGGGGRFAAGVKAIEKKGTPASEAKAIMASAGRKKFGDKKFNAMSSAGRKRAAKKERMRRNGKENERSKER